MSKTKQEPELNKTSTVRFNEKHYLKYKALAALEGYQNLSEYIRHLLDEKINDSDFLSGKA